MKRRRKRRGLPDRLELQLHFADLRRGLRTIFLRRRGQRTALAGLGAAVLIVVVGLALLPWSGPAIWRAYLHDRATDEGERLTERLERQIGRWEALADEVGETRRRVDQIYLAYGLGELDDSGRGGYPRLPVEAPDGMQQPQLTHALRLEATTQEQLDVLSILLAEIDTFETAHSAQVRLTPSILPVEGEEWTLTSPFGRRHSPFTGRPDMHTGLDLAGPTGLPIVAPADGEVVFSGRYPLRQSVAWWRYGNLVVLRHGERFMTVFAHCDELLVRRGERVRQGDPIATVGNSGWSTSPHLHYEVRRRLPEAGFEPVDPRIYILNRRWTPRERALVASRPAPGMAEYEPLPPIFGLQFREEAR